MGLDDIIARIEAEAEAESKLIIKEALGQASRIEKEAGEELRREILELRKRLDRDSITQRNIYLSEGKRRSRQTILSAKEQLIWDAFVELRRLIRSLEGRSLENFLKWRADRCRAVLGDDMVLRPVREVDRKALVELGERCGPAVSGTSEGYINALQGGRDLLGGFIASSSDGRRIIDMTFLGLMEKDEDPIREKIAKELFGDFTR